LDGLVDGLIEGGLWFQFQVEADGLVDGLNDGIRFQWCWCEAYDPSSSIDRWRLFERLIWRLSKLASVRFADVVLILSIDSMMLVSAVCGLSLDMSVLRSSRLASVRFVDVLLILSIDSMMLVSAVCGLSLDMSVLNKIKVYVKFLTK
jgi:hypothetical protein